MQNIKRKILSIVGAITFCLLGSGSLLGQIPTPTPYDPANIGIRGQTENECEIWIQYVARGRSPRAAIDEFLATAKRPSVFADNSHQACSLAGAGRVFAELGDPVSALKYFEEALATRQTKDEALNGYLLVEIGLIYNKQGEHGKALAYFLRDYELRERQKDIAGQINTLHNIAMLYGDLGDLEASRKIYEKLVILEHARGEPRIEAASINNLAFVYFRLGNYQKAAAMYQQAHLIGIRRKLEDIQAATIIGLGDSYLKLKSPKRALNYYRSGLALSIKVGNRIWEADALFGIGDVYETLGQNHLALDHFRRALELQHALQAREEEGRTLTSLMRLLAAMGQRNLSILYGKKAINLNQNIRQNIKVLDKDTQRLYLKTKEQAYRDLSNLLIAEGRLPEAQAVLDMLKEQEYEQFTTLRSGESPDLVPYRNAETTAMLRIDTLAALGVRQRELVAMQSELGPKFPEEKRVELEKVRKDIEAANREFRLAIDALARRESSVEEKLGEIKTEKNLQRTLDQLGRELKTGVVAIYTVIGADDTKATTANALARPRFGWAVLVTPESRKAYPIDVRGLENTVVALRNALKSDKYDPKPLAQRLYDAIFRQTSPGQRSTLETDLGVIFAGQEAKTIMWSLDGLLRYVPMAVLHDGKQYLVEKYRQTVFTKQSLLLLKDKDAPLWQALGLGVSEAKKIDKQSFDALTGAKRELEDIVREPNEMTGILGGTRVLNGDFTKEKAIELWREGRYQAIHIASHFSFDPAEQSRSFLVVGDGKLTFADIQDKDNLFGSVDLLTLSACETAMNSNGKESEGFPFLAQSLGAKTVIASLWKVSDAGTPDLMIRFYKLRAENPTMPKGEAFRRAQLTLLSGETASAPPGPAVTKSGKRSDPFDLDGTQTKLSPFVKDPAKPFAHPYYWASFVLIGNWR